MNNIKNTNYSFRYLSRIIIEAITPLAVGSGEKDIYTDALVATDINGLPYIPGSSIAGVLRSMTDEDSAKTLFGFQDDDNSGIGSKIIISDAKLLNSKGEVSDSILSENEKNDSLLQCYTDLPIRQHVRISANGVAESAGKFDEQVVFAGSRFCFEIEIVCTQADSDIAASIISKIADSSFRLGGGTRTGFGSVRIVEVKSTLLKLSDEKDLRKYLDKTSCLNDRFWDDVEETSIEKPLDEQWTKYTLRIRPESFFNIGSGLADDEVDMTPVKAKKVEWQNNGGRLVSNLVLIPASSLKGALAHRTAFHWNSKNNQYASDNATPVGDDNPAVRLLFGYQDQKNRKQQRGCVLMNDIIDASGRDIVLAHVNIDRFTGGASKGALFDEKAVYGENKCYVTEILVAKENNPMLNKDDNTDYTTVIDSFELALRDLVTGRLALGGGSSRGNGIFNGQILKDGKQL